MLRKNKTKIILFWFNYHISLKSLYELWSVADIVQPICIWIICCICILSLLFRKWEDDLVMDMAEWLADDLPLPPGSPGGMTEYRRTLCISFFYKFYLAVLLQIKQTV
jgi:hypothetical protein